MKRIIRKAILASTCFALLPLLGLSSMNEGFEHPNIPPKYILSLDTEAPIIADPNSNWIYYPLSGDDYGDNYAVALSEKGKSTTESSLTIESTIRVNEKDAKVVGIWHNGFQDSPKTLKEVKLTSNILVIDFEAFFHSYITSIVIPYSVEKIGDAAFYACSELTSVIIQDNDHDGGNSSIQCECGEESDGDDDEDTLSLRSPISVTPKKVHRDDDGVQWCTLEKIPSFCFFRCQKLNRFVPNSYLKEIEWEAFNGCYALNSPLYFYRLETIRARAFQGCSAIPSVTIYQTLFSKPGIIEPHAFNYCGSSIQFYFNKSGTWLSNHSDWGINNDSGTSTYHGSTQVHDPDITEQELVASDWAYDTKDSFGTVNNAEGNSEGVIITNYLGEAPGETWGTSLLIVPEKLDEKPVRGIAAGAFDRVKNKLRRLYLPKTLFYIDNELFTDWNGDDKQYDTAAASFPYLQIISWNGDECTDQNALRDKDENNAPIGVAKESNAKYLDRRIDLSRLRSLQFIGRRAFYGLGLRKNITINETTGACTLNTGHVGDAGGITKIHFPYRLISVGDEAFSKFNAGHGGYFRKLTSFIWDYKDPNPETGEPGSRLETIGESTFYKFGRDTSADNESRFNDRSVYRSIEPSTLIFPKTFKYFGVLDSTNNQGPNDIQDYNTKYGFLMKKRYDTGNRNNRPSHAFTGSPMFRKVIFKGGHNNVSDLIIPSQTFAFCDSLQTLICEERWNTVGSTETACTITFHTQNGQYAQTTVGSHGSVAKNDFRREPSLQTIVLPNLHTKLRIQSIAFQGCSRAALYFSGGEKNNMFGNTAANPDKNGNAQWTRLIPGSPNYNTAGDQNNIDSLVQWDTIGDETCFGKTEADYKGYLGYAFDTNNKDPFVTNPYNNIDSITFGLDQRIPKYWGVHYKEVINEQNAQNVTVEVGDDSCGNYLTINGKCAYVCNSATRKATMSKYLFDQTGADYKTAKVLGHVASRIPGTDASFDSIRYEVNEIGDSAFSAAFYDAERNDDDGNAVCDTLNNIEVPDSIAKIGDYALMRAYGVRHFGVKKTNGNDVSYEMPMRLRYIGKYAFLFCSVEAFNKIPYDCVFFENANNEAINAKNKETGNNENIAYKISSVFSNNVYLRRITFLNAAKTSEVYSSRYYSTATYYSSSTGKTYTTAVFADNVNKYRDETGIEKDFYKRNRLLLVLGRDADKKCLPGTDVTNYDTNKVRFDAKHGIANPNPFLFGAFRMANWADSINVGPATKSGENDGDTFVQPLFAGVYIREDLGNGNNKGAMRNTYVRLHQKVRHYTDNKVDLKSFTGDTLRMPRKGFTGCGNLTFVEFSDEAEGVIPGGLFDTVKNGELKYATSSDSTTAGKLDLTNTGYKTISSQAFKDNAAIKHFVAPITASGSTFTIEANAFEKCSNLEIVDFSNVQGTLKLGANAFKECKIKTIIWPAGKTEIDGDGIFRDNKELSSLVLPANTSNRIGQNCFKGCSKLESVTVENGSVITAIGTSAFQDCTILNAFDFDSFTNLTTIGNEAFKGAGTIAEGGIVSFPSHITSFGDSSFNNAKITHVIFNNTRSGGIHLGNYAFANEENLTGVHFVHSDCAWTDGETHGTGTFNGCDNLTEVQLPETFPLTASGDYVNGSENVVYYLHSKQYGANISPELIKRGDQGVVAAPVCWLVTSATDLINFETETLQSGIELDGGDGFWLLRNGDECAIDLGVLHSYSANDGSLVFVKNTTYKTIYCISNSASLVDNDDLTSDAKTNLYYDSTTKTILGRASEYDSGSNSVVFENGMRLMTNATSAYVEVKTVDELLNGSSLVGDALSTNYYYLDYEGNVVYLGKAIAYNSTTKAISFSNDGGSTFSYLCKASDAYDLISGDSLISNATNTYYYGIDAGNFNRIIVFGKAVSYDSSSGTVLFENNMRLSLDKTILHSVSNSNDLIENDGLASGANNKKYYYVDADHNDAIVSLGSAVSYDSSTGMVLFENGDMRIDSSGRLLMPVMTIDSLVSEGSPTSEALTTYYYYVDPSNGNVIYLGKASSCSSGGLWFDQGFAIHQVSDAGDLLNGGSLISGATTQIYSYYIDSVHNDEIIPLGLASEYDSQTILFSTNMRLGSDGELYHLIASSADLANASALVSEAMTTNYWILEGSDPVLLGRVQSYDEKSKTVLFPNDIRLDAEGHLVHKLTATSSLIDNDQLISGATDTYYWFLDGDVVILLGKAHSTSDGSVVFTSDYVMKSDNILYKSISHFTDVVSDGALMTDPNTVYSIEVDNETIQLGTAISYDSLTKTVVFSNGIGIDENDGLVYKVDEFDDLVEQVDNEYQWKTGAEGESYLFLDDNDSFVYLGIPESYDVGSGTKTILFSSGLCVDENGKLVYPFETVEVMLNGSSLTGEAKSTHYYYVDPVNGHVVCLGKASSYDTGTGTITFDSGLSVRQIVDASELLNGNNNDLANGIDNLYLYYVDVINYSEIMYLGKAVSYHTDSETVLFGNNMRLDTEGNLFRRVSNSMPLVSNHDLAAGAMDNYYWFDDGGIVVILGHAVSCDERYDSVLFDKNDIRLDVEGHLVHKLTAASSLIDNDQLISGATDTYYWFLDGDVVILLGKAHSTSDGSVVFTSDYAMDTNNVLYKEIDNINDLMIRDTFAADPSTVYSFKNGDTSVSLGLAVSYDEGSGTILFGSDIRLDNDHLVYLITVSGDIVSGGALIAGTTDTYYYYVDAANNGAIILLGQAASYNLETQTIEFTGNESTTYFVDADGNLTSEPKE